MNTLERIAYLTATDPEPPISGVFLNIELPKRHVLTPAKPPWRYVHTYTWRIVA